MPAIVAFLSKIGSKTAESAFNKCQDELDAREKIIFHHACESCGFN